MDAARGNERRPTVVIDDMSEPAAGVMRKSADDDVHDGFTGGGMGRRPLPPPY